VLCWQGYDVLAKSNFVYLKFIFHVKDSFFISNFLCR